MQKNMEKSKHILFKYQTIEELIQGTGYKPSFKALALITPNMTVDSLIEKLMEINEITLACEVMIYALHPRTRIWWGCSIIKSLHEELFAKPEEQKAAEAEAEGKAPKEKAEAVALPKSKEEAKEMLSQKVGEQKEALGLTDVKKDGNDSEKASETKSENDESSYEQTKEEIEKLTAQQEKLRAEQEKAFDEESKQTKQQLQETLKKFEEIVANMPPESKAFYDECQTKIDQYFKENIGMTKQEYIDFVKEMVEKAGKADKSGDSVAKEAVFNEVVSVLSEKSDVFAKAFEEMKKNLGEYEQKQDSSSSETKTETEATEGTEENAKAEEKTEIDIADLKKEKEEAQKAEKIKEVEAKAAELENNLRKRAYEAAVAWVNEPTKTNTLNVEKYSQEAGSYPEGMLCMASYWSYGDFAISSSAQKKEEGETKEKGKAKQPETIIRVDPSLPPKGIYSTFLMAALHEGGTRKPVDRFVLYYLMGEKIACGKDNWTSEQIKARQNQSAMAAEKPELKPEVRPEANQEEKPEVKPTYTKWKM